MQSWTIKSAVRPTAAQLPYASKKVHLSRIGILRTSQKVNCCCLQSTSLVMLLTLVSYSYFKEECFYSHHKLSICWRVFTIHWWTLALVTRVTSNTSEAFPLQKMFQYTASVFSIWFWSEIMINIIHFFLYIMFFCNMLYQLHWCHEFLIRYLTDLLMCLMLTCFAKL